MRGYDNKACDWIRIFKSLNVQVGRCYCNKTAACIIEAIKYLVRGHSRQTANRFIDLNGSCVDYPEVHRVTVTMVRVSANELEEKKLPGTDARQRIHSFLRKVETIVCTIDHCHCDRLSLESYIPASACYTVRHQRPLPSLIQ